MVLHSYYVTQSTSVLQFDLNTGIPNPILNPIVYLSTLYSPGLLVTIRDITGYASITNTITISTTTGNWFLDGVNPTNYSINRFNITQPYGFITLTPRNSTIWAVINTFAFNDSNASASVSNLYVNYEVVSSIDAGHMNISTISSLATGWSQVNLGSTLQTGFFSTMGNINMGGRFSTPNVIVSGSTIYTVHNVSSNLSSVTGFISSLSVMTGFISSTKGYDAVFSNLSATTGFISTLSVMTGFISSTTGYDAVFSNLSATTGFISSLSVMTGFISSTRGYDAVFSNLSATTGFISSLSVMTGFISSTTGYDAVFSNLSATTGFISSLSVMTGFISSTTGYNAVFSNLSATTAFISSTRGDTAFLSNLSSTTAFISSTRGDSAFLSNLSSTTGFINTLSVMTGFISSAKGYDSVFSNISASTGYISSLRFGSLVNINATFTPNFLTLDVGSNAVPTTLTAISTLRVFGPTFMVGSNGGLNSILKVAQLQANQDIAHLIDNSTQNYIYMGMNPTTTTMSIGAYNYTTGIKNLNLQANGGSVGIGGVNPSSYALDVVGTIHASSDIIASSDERVKTNIVTVTSALSTIHAMRGVFYSPIHELTTRKLGLIAQEVERVLPEVVQTDTTEEAMKSIAYGNITALLIEGIKELSSTVQGMRSSKSFA